MWGAIAGLGASLVGSMLSKSGSGGETTQQSTMTPGQRALLDSLAQIERDQLGQPISWDTAPWKSDTQSQLYSLLPGMINTSQQQAPLYSQSQNVLEKLLDDFDPTATRNYWEEGVVNPSIKNWEDNIIPIIQEKYASNNALSSGAYNRALAKSGADLTSNLSAELSKLMYKGKSDWEDRQMQSIPMSAQLSSNSINDKINALIAISNLGSGETSAEMQKWLAEQDYNNPWLKYLPTALNQRAFENTYQQQGPSTFGNLMGGVGSLGSSYLSNGGWADLMKGF